MRIDDLRTTLAEHAEVSHDAGLVGRADAVRGRVRTVRRRRAAVAVACVAGAVLALPVVRALEVTPPEPASDRDLAGRTAPENLVSNGFTYDFADAVEGPTDEPLDLRLKPSDEPRLVSWTVNADGDEPVAGRLVDRRAGEPTTDWTAGGEDFETWRLVAPGAEVSYRLTPVDPVPGGEMAIAVYRISDEVPAGVSGQGVTFRDDVAGARLLGATIGEPGTRSVTLEVRLPEGELRLSDLCTGGGPGVERRVEVAGETGYFGTTCDDPLLRDAGAGSWYGFDLVGTPKPGGGRYQVGDRVELTAGTFEKGTDRETSTDGVVALAAYAEPDGVALAGTGETVERIIEREGHTWTLSDLVTSEPGDLALDHRVGPARSTTYVEPGAAARGPVRWSTTVDGDELARAYRGPAGAYGPDANVVVGRGGTSTVVQRLVGAPNPTARFYVAEYELAD